MSASQLPVYFISHGGGPMPLLGDPGHKDLVEHWKALGPKLGRPKAVLVVSAHWEERVATVTSAASHSTLIYDYYGFPKESYEIKYPSPGDPALASRVHDLVKAAGLPVALDPERSLDHGVFVPLKVLLPAADIPVLQLSLFSSLRPEEHLALGRALAPLRKEGVLILCSGFSFHNMHAFFSSGGGAVSWSKAFGKFLTDSCALTGLARDAALTAWSKAPHARDCHPREEHLIPLLVAAGAAESDPGRVLFRTTLLNIESLDFVFGDSPSC